VLLTQLVAKLTATNGDGRVCVRIIAKPRGHNASHLESYALKMLKSFLLHVSVLIRAIVSCKPASLTKCNLNLMGCSQNVYCRTLAFLFKRALAMR
jgi:hypothetical protein